MRLLSSTPEYRVIKLYRLFLQMTWERHHLIKHALQTEAPEYLLNASRDRDHSAKEVHNNIIVQHIYATPMQVLEIMIGFRHRRQNFPDLCLTTNISS
jgi:hypothetical protein